MKLNEVTVDGVTFRVGDVVRPNRPGAWAVRIEGLAPLAPPEQYPWGDFTPVKKDGTRDRRKTAYSGALRGYVKVTM